VNLVIHAEVVHGVGFGSPTLEGVPKFLHGSNVARASA
jgi:hypothetical protein